MKYILLMQATKANWDTFTTLPPEDIKAHIAFMSRANKQLTDSGELVDAQGLAGPDQAKVVRAQPGGPPVVTDGPFPESKEFLAGWWVVDVESPERAIAIAAYHSTAPGRRGVPLNIPIEVRQVMGGPSEVE